FDPRRVRAMSDEALESLLDNARLIRHWGKLKSVRDNAAAMLEVAGEYGGVGAWLAGWPGQDVVGLWETLAKRFSQLGGNSGPSFLRMTGKDTFILTPSVTSALKHWGVRSEEHTSELQSRGHLVCRLLLEKKKTKNKNNTEVQ